MEECTQVGYLGRANIDDSAASLVPQLVAVPRAVSIAAGRSAGAAVTADGAVYTWGSGALGRAGAKETPAPVQGLAATPVSKVCMGEFHAAAVTREGGVLVWGPAAEGQLEQLDGVSSAETAVPLQGWPSERFATALACGFQHTLIISSEARDTAACAMSAASRRAETDAIASTMPLSDGAAAAAEVAAPSLAPSDTALASNMASNTTESALDPALDEAQQPLDAAALDPPPTSAAALSLRDSLTLLQRPRTIWAAEDCRMGPRPPWIADCANMPDPINVHALDRAWFGMFQPASAEQVCLAPLCSRFRVGGRKSDRLCLRSNVVILTSWLGVRCALVPYQRKTASARHPLQRCPRVGRAHCR